MARSDYLNRGDGYTDMFTLKKFIKLMIHDSCIFLYLCYTSMKSSVKKEKKRDVPGGPVVKIPCFQCRGHRFNPLMGNEDPQRSYIVQPPKEKPNLTALGRRGHNDSYAIKSLILCLTCSVLVRAIQRNRINGRFIFIIRNGLIQLWRLISSKICSWQARDLGELMALVQSEG